MQILKQTRAAIKPVPIVFLFAVYLIYGAFFGSEFLPKPDYMQRGCENFGKSKFKDAIKDFNHVIENDPNNCVGYWGRGLTEKYLHQYPEAFQDLTTAIEKNPNVADLYALRADICNCQEKWTQAMNDINEAIAMNPTDSLYYCTRSKTYSETKKHALALKDANKALQFKPNSSEAFRRRAFVKWRDCDLQGAVDDFDKAYKSDKTDLRNISARKSVQEMLEYCKMKGIPLESLRD
ncbi:MAG: hypothetical protein SFY67_10315 [Candidatus Melainabacteria bacterium]|nr:hypothetical protein [Candidatus Melainabacteria bacterium]